MRTAGTMAIVAGLLSSVASVLPAHAMSADELPTSAPADPATSEDEDDRNRERDEVLVTGERERRAGQTGAKTDTPLISLAQTITAIDNAELTRRNALSINQAVGYVAGVAPNQRGNVATRYDQLYVRGFTPGLFLDGMRQQGGVYANMQVDFHLIDSIDIIKGPASVLYGSGAPGGLVNLTSKLPYAEAGGRIELAGGNFDLLRSAIDVNQPLDRDGRWQFRVIAGAEQSDGFIRHTRNRRYYAKPMLTFAPDDATSVTVTLSYQRDPEAASYSGVPVFGSALPTPLGELPVDLNVSEPEYERFDRTQKMATLQFRHQFGDALTWTTNARWFDVDLSYRQIYLTFTSNTNLDANGNSNPGRITRGGGGADERFRTLTLDNRLAATFATGPVQHTFLAGLDWLNNEGRNDQAFLTGTNANPALNVPNLDLYDPVYGIGLPTSDITRFPGVTRNFRRIDQLGVYVQDQLRIGGLNLIASGRYDWYSQLTRSRVTGAVTPLKQNAFTGRLGALYEFGFGLSPCVSYSTSFEPQSGTGYTGSVVGGAAETYAFEPVTGRQYEAGLKFQPRGTNALFTLSAFDLRRQNVPVADPRAPLVVDGVTVVPNNAQVQVGEVKVRGIELDGRGDIAPGLSLTVAGTYNDAITTRGNPASGSGGQLAGVEGTRPLGVPKWSASSFVSYDLEHAVVGAAGGFSIGAGVRYVGESEGTVQSVVATQLVTERFRSPGFVLADAVLGYDFGAIDPSVDGLSFTVNAANLFNKRHIASCFFNNSCYFGAARTVVGTLRFDW